MYGKAGEKAENRAVGSCEDRLLTRLRETIRCRKGGLTTSRRLPVCPTRLATTIAILMACPYASALNPSLDINQYAHTTWTVREGLIKSVIHSIAQTPDGYLWLGTEFGLIRFDGVRAAPWQPPAGEHLPSNYVRGVLAARDGRLWIATDKGLASWKDGKLAHYRELAGHNLVTLLEDREGTIWAGGYVIPNGSLCKIQNGSTQCFGQDGNLGHQVTSLYEDSRGNLWAGGMMGLWRWKPGSPTLYPIPAGALEIRSLMEGDNGALLIAVGDEIRQLVHGDAGMHPLPGAGRQFTPLRMLRDRNGGLWIGTDRGLRHVYQGKTDVFAKSDGLSGDFVLSLFEDREGNIWVGTRDGLDRFREFAASTISLKQGLSSAAVGSVLAAGDGSVWLGTREGLNRWNDGRVTIYRKRSGGLPDDEVESLFLDDRGRVWASTRRGIAYFENGRFIRVNAVPAGYVHSVAGDSVGNVWISQDESLFHLLGGSLAERIPWTKLGHTDPAVALLPDGIEGGLWSGFWRGGMVYLRNGRVLASYAGSDGLGEGSVESLQLDRDGTLWAATEGGLSRVKNGRVATLSSKNGLPCDTVHSVMEADDHSYWLYMACGLVRIARPELDAWVADSQRTIQTTVFDSSDGVRSHLRAGGYSLRVAKSTDGKLWFLPFDGVSVIDPRHLPFNRFPPPVHIEQITADRKPQWQNSSGVAASSLRLPALSRDVEIDYTALSLIAPEKIHFRVKLDGRDPDWKDVGNERKAFYNDLPPRNYRFRVMASNNSGVWNEAGDSLDFSIAPAYYQTTYFRLSCVAAFFALLWALHRYRLHQIAQEFNVRLEERVNERTRIARDLHDTLLQSFQGLMLRFQVVDELLPARPAEAKEALENALERGDQAIVEGREAVGDLRSSTEVTNDLGPAVKALGDELASADSARFHLAIDGSPRDLHPILRDEIYRIAREAVRNAFSHARAREIEAEITYGARLLRLRIRDDGRGMDPGIVEEGRDGHYGLAGMRERAKHIGGELKIWTGTGAGTEIELCIPGSIAYGKSATRWWHWLRPEKATADKEGI